MTVTKQTFRTGSLNGTTKVFPIISNLTTESKRPEETAYISRRYHQKMTSEKRAQKFHTTRHYTDRFTTQIWVVPLIGRVTREIFENLLQPIRSTTRYGWWHLISMEFLHPFLRCHFAGKPVLRHFTTWSVFRWTVLWECYGKLTPFYWLLYIKK